MLVVGDRVIAKGSLTERDTGIYEEDLANIRNKEFVVSYVSYVADVIELEDVDWLFREDDLVEIIE